MFVRTENMNYNSLVTVMAVAVMEFRRFTNAYWNYIRRKEGIHDTC